MDTTLKSRIEGVVGGNRASSAWLYDNFSSLLFRRLRARYTPLGLDAEELLHDAYVFYLQHDARVLRNLLERFESKQIEATESAVQKYLWDLACGVASNKLRSQKRAVVVPLNNDVLQTSDDTIQTNLTQDILRQLDDCLGSKNARMYLYFKLRFVDGLRPEEISQATGWSRKATYKLKQVFNEALKECAARLGIDT